MQVRITEKSCETWKPRYLFYFAEMKEAQWSAELKMKFWAEWFIILDSFFHSRRRIQGETDVPSASPSRRAPSHIACSLANPPELHRAFVSGGLFQPSMEGSTKCYTPFYSESHGLGSWQPRNIWFFELKEIFTEKLFQEWPVFQANFRRTHFLWWPLYSQWHQQLDRQLRKSQFLKIGEKF